MIAVAPDWTQAASVVRYGWMAFGFAVAGIAVYFAALIPKTYTEDSSV